MSDSQKMFVPSGPLPAGRSGLLTPFDPGTRTLAAGFQVAPPFRPLPVDVVFEKDVAVRLRDGVTIYVDVFRPTGVAKVPVIVAWSPYGKAQGTSASVMGVFGLVGLSNKIVSGLFGRSGSGVLVRPGLRHLQPRHSRRRRFRRR